MFLLVTCPPLPEQTHIYHHCTCEKSDTVSVCFATALSQNPLKSPWCRSMSSLLSVHKKQTLSPVYLPRQDGGINMFCGCSFLSQKYIPITWCLCSIPPNTPKSICKVDRFKTTMNTKLSVKARWLAGVSERVAWDSSNMTTTNSVLLFFSLSVCKKQNLQSCHCISQNRNGQRVCLFCSDRQNSNVAIQCLFLLKDPHIYTQSKLLQNTHQIKSKHDVKMARRSERGWKPETAQIHPPQLNIPSLSVHKSETIQYLSKQPQLLQMLCDCSVHQNPTITVECLCPPKTSYICTKSTSLR